MIRVTIWNEYLQESGVFDRNDLPADMPEEKKDEIEKFVKEGCAKIKEVYPLGVTGTIAAHLEKCEDMEITHVNMLMDEFGLPDELLEKTDVLVWWSHVGHDKVPDELIAKIKERILKGMGFIALHSSHPCKVMQTMLGTSGSLKWREGDRERVWCINPTHPIAAGIPEHFELEEEEMYGEPFDIPTPDELIFLGWFKGGEVFRSGCVWNRGYGKVFYFQPGHETCPSYHNEYVLKIIENGIRYVKPVAWRADLLCPNTEALEK